MNVALDCEGTEVRVGDIVICWDDTHSFNRLREGQEHVVTAAYDGTPTVEVARCYHSMDRFIRKSTTA